LLLNLQLSSLDQFLKYYKPGTDLFVAGSSSNGKGGAIEYLPRKWRPEELVGNEVAEFHHNELWMNSFHH
jgi:hypothetical protein